MDASALTGILIIAGHYGVGKTNLALNVCVDAARAGKHTTCVDLDIVNPYFRSSDYEDLLRTLPELLTHHLHKRPNIPLYRWYSASDKEWKTLTRSFD